MEKPAQPIDPSLPRTIAGALALSREMLDCARSAVARAEAEHFLRLAEQAHEAAQRRLQQHLLGSEHHTKLLVQVVQVGDALRVAADELAVRWNLSG